MSQVAQETGYMAVVGEHTSALTVFAGPYFRIVFQDGPVPEHGVNGTTNEEIIRLVIRRIESLNKIMHSDYNDAAIQFLQYALSSLEARTEDRQQRGVEGTLAP